MCRKRCSLSVLIPFHGRLPAGTEILYEGDRVIGVRTGDKGLNSDGSKGSNFEPGIDLHAKVTVFGEGSRGSLTKKASARLAELGRIAKAHADFPVLVVVHSARGRASAGDAAQAKEVARVLTEAGAPRVETHTAGDAQPVVRRTQRGAGARNRRVEIVFVSPSS